MKSKAKKIIFAVGFITCFSNTHTQAVGYTKSYTNNEWLPGLIKLFVDSL